MLWSVCSHHICGGDWPQSGDWAASFFLSGSDFSDCWLSRGLCFTLLFMFDHIWLYHLICVCLYVNVFLFGPRGVLWTAVLLTLKLPLQAAVPMATFHSHLFSIWLWHIHLKIQKHTKRTARCGHVLLKAKFFIIPCELKQTDFTDYRIFSDSQKKCAKCICQITPYVSVVGGVGLEVLMWCEWSGYSYPLFSPNATLHEFVLNCYTE